MFCFSLPENLTHTITPANVIIITISTVAKAIGRAITRILTVSWVFVMPPVPAGGHETSGCVVAGGAVVIGDSSVCVSISIPEIKLWVCVGKRRYIRVVK